MSRGGGFALELAPDELDAERFEALVDAARGVDADAAAPLLATALGLWRGPAFGDRADVGCVRPEARRLEERRAAAGEAHAVALLASRRPDEAVAVAEALVSAAPLREGGWVVLIEALAAAQRSAEALRAFQRAAEALAEAGLDPSPRLRQAERAALPGGDETLLPPDDRGEGAASRSSRYRPPLVSSSFVGRHDDCDQIVELLQRTRLVTLTGPGGVGKTRLAIEVARRVAECTQLGACVVELAVVDDADAVPDVVIASLRLTADGRPAREILNRVGAFDVLIVLDNAEHVINAVADTARRLLAGGPTARLLVTSRERLAVDGEHVWTVAPLATTGSDAPAAQLFRERAEAVGATPADAFVARIAQRLDGLPLAIEMAAAQLDTTTPEELADALDERLDDLRSPRRDVAERHRSLADVLAWSEARLDDRQAATLADLSVFAGPVAIGDIEGVLGSGDVGAVVRSLVRRSLVSVERSRSPARFYLLQTVREFAAHRLAAAGRTEELARRHASWFLAVARAADGQLRTAEEAQAHSRFVAVFAELRAAQWWAVRHDLDLAAALAAHLHVYAQSRFVEEPLLWGELLLPRVTDDHPRRPILLASAATRAIRRGDIGQARRLAAEALEQARGTPAALPALDLLSDAGLFDGRLGDTTEAALAVVEIARRAGDLFFLGLGHGGLALARVYAGEASDAEETALHALGGLPLPPSARGWVAYALGETCTSRQPDAALEHLAQALAHSRAVGNRYLEGVTIVSSCSLRARQGDVADALAAFAEAVHHWKRLANVTLLLTTLRNLAELFKRADAPEAVAEVLGAVERADVPTYGVEASRLQDARAWASRRLGSERFDELVAAGAQRDVAQAADAALDAIGLLSCT